MKKIIIKTASFGLPYLFLFLFTLFFYSSAESPDLLRLGYFPNVSKDYRNEFKDEFNRKTYFHSFSTEKSKKAKILTIGDSFSEQNNFGYKNYLAEKRQVLHLDRFISKNQIATLYELLNGDFFEIYNIDYIVLENVERSFIYNSKKINLTEVKTVVQLEQIAKKYEPTEEENVDLFFSKRNLSFPFWFSAYYFNENYLSNEKVYNLTLKTNKLFSNNSNKLLFVSDDLKNLKKNNDLNEVRKLNNVLNDLSNKLSVKNIKLIVLPAPDKYDMYYDYISDKRDFPKPLFFQMLGSLKKDYIYIDSKEILSNQLEKIKDIYFYDDSHWSPVGSKIIANEVEKATN